jgi:hypothetical protein
MISAVSSCYANSQCEFFRDLRLNCKVHTSLTSIESGLRHELVPELLELGDSLTPRPQCDCFSNSSSTSGRNVTSHDHTSAVSPYSISMTLRRPRYLPSLMRASWLGSRVRPRRDIYMNHRLVAIPSIPSRLREASTSSKPTI